VSGDVALEAALYQYVIADMKHGSAWCLLALGAG